MREHLTDELRNLIIKLVNEGKKNLDICSLLKCSRHQVYRVMKSYDLDGRCDRKKTGTKHKKINEEASNFIIDLIDDDCSITLKSIKQKLEDNFGINVCLTTISHVIGSFSYSFKRVHLIPEKRNTKETIDLRYEYIVKLLRCLSEDQSKIFFVDETGYNVSMRSLYGRSTVNTTPTKSVTQIRTKNLSVSCCISKEKSIYSEISESPYNRHNYGSFLKNLFNVLYTNKITKGVFIMDNVPFHKCQEIRNSFIAHGHSVLYLPPYSPFLNPIEEAFSKMKRIVRIAEPKTSEELIRSVKDSFNNISKEDCTGYFDHMKKYIDLCLNKEIIEY